MENFACAAIENALPPRMEKRMRPIRISSTSPARPTDPTIRGSPTSGTARSARDSLTFRVHPTVVSGPIADGGSVVYLF